MGKWRIKLISDIDKAPGFGSIWASGAGFVLAFMDAILSSYHLLPSNVRDLIPESSPVFAVMFAVVMLARVFKIEKVEDDGNSSTNELR